MTGESDNLPFGGTDNAHPHFALDHPDNLNFDEPDEQPDNQEDQQGVTDADIETVEAEEFGQETDEPATDDEATQDHTEEGDGEPERDSVQDDVMINIDGSQLPLSELKTGYMKQADYSRKTQDLSNRRRDLEAMSGRVSATVDAITTFLAERLPAEPDAALAMSNPNEYIQKKAMYEAAVGQLEQIMKAKSGPNEIGAQLSTEQRQELLSQEDAKLVEALPFIADPKKRAEFNQQIFDTASSLGFSAEELNSSTDHRFIILGHYARLGMQAEKAKQKVATKVANVPPVTPQKRPQGQNPARVRGNQEAMKRLNKSGSIHDAMKIDFD